MLNIFKSCPNPPGKHEKFACAWAYVFAHMTDQEAWRTKQCMLKFLYVLLSQRGYFHSCFYHTGLQLLTRFLHPTVNLLRRPSSSQTSVPQVQHNAWGTALVNQCLFHKYVNDKANTKVSDKERRIPWMHKART